MPASARVYLPQGSHPIATVLAAGLRERGALMRQVEERIAGDSDPLRLVVVVHVALDILREVEHPDGLVLQSPLRGRNLDDHPLRTGRARVRELQVQVAVIVGELDRADETGDGVEP